MGFLLIAPLILMTSYLVYKTYLQVTSSRESMGLFWGLCAVGLALGYYLAFHCIVTPTPTLRMEGFPVPRIFAVTKISETAHQTNTYVLPPAVQAGAVVADFTFALAVSQLPLWIRVALRKIRKARATSSGPGL